MRAADSPPVALHLASRRRSYIRLQAGVCLPEEDFHLSDQIRLQTHEFTLQRAHLEARAQFALHPWVASMVRQPKAGQWPGEDAICERRKTAQAEAEWHEIKASGEGGRVWSRTRRPGERLGGLLENYALMQSEFGSSPAGASLRPSPATLNLVPFG